MTTTDRAGSLRRFVLGQAGPAGPIASYRRFDVAGSLLEEFWWGALPAPVRNSIGTVADSGWLWARCWIPDLEALLDRVFDAGRLPVGIHVYVTLPLLRATRQWHTLDLILGVWLAPDGRVTVLNEDAFEQACTEGRLTQAETERAESHVRDLTRRIAARTFPPAWVLQYNPTPP